ncbi:hypothetical protein SGPA1_40877 [Streptomyces misionensis JCM 4497]
MSARRSWPSTPTLSSPCPVDSARWKRSSRCGPGASSASTPSLWASSTREASGRRCSMPCAAWSTPASCPRPPWTTLPSPPTCTVCWIPLRNGCAASRSPRTERVCDSSVRLRRGSQSPVTRLLPLLGAIPPVRGRVGRPPRRPDSLFADRGYEASAAVFGRFRSDKEAWECQVRPGSP